MTSTVVGKPLARVDGKLKVTGAARYAADFNQPRQAYAVIVGSTVGLGRITRVDAGLAERMQGVLAVVSHLNAPRLPYTAHKGPIDPASGERLHVLQDDQVRFYGQPVAVVVAETLNDAERAAGAVQVEYAPSRPQVDFGAAEHVAPEAAQRPGARIQADRQRGNSQAAFAVAPVKVDAVYAIARENHNPMEPHATVAAWDIRRTLPGLSERAAADKRKCCAIRAALIRRT